MGMIGNTLAQGLISGANIVDGTVDTPDIKDSAVTTAKIADGVVTPGKLSTGAPTWDTSGNFGIGTSAPSAALDIDKSQNAVTSLRIGNTNTGSSAHARLLIVSDGGNIQMKALSTTNTTYGVADVGVINCDNMSGGLRFSHNDAVKMNFDFSGSLIVNGSTSTGSPVGKLQVWENSSSSSYVCIDARSGQAGGASVGAYTTTLLQGSGGNSGSSGNVAIKMHHNDNLDLRGDLSFWTKDNQNTQYERLRIVSTGKIGAGTSDPQSLLHLTGNSSGAIYSALTLQNTDNSSYGQGVSINFKNSSYSGVEAKKYGYITYRAESSWGEKGQFLIGLNNGYNVAPTNYVVINPSGDFYPNVNGGSLYARAALAYSALTDLGWTAPIQVQETGTGTNSYRYMPIISGTSVSSSGYRQHTVFGAARGTTWGEAFIAVGGNDAYPTTGFYFSNNGNFSASGTKNFAIDHPVESLSETHQLLHAAVEAPRADLIYRGVVDLVGGTASVSIDAASNMTDGTFALLCRNVQCFTTNETDWTPVRGSVVDGVLTIQAQDPNSTARISWMVVGERKDSDAMRAYDDNGAFVTERLKSAAPVIDPNYELAPAPSQNNEVQE